MIQSLGFAVLLLTYGFESFATASPVWNIESVQTQGVKDFLNKIGSALCKAAYDGSNPNALAEAIQSLGEMDEAEIESVEDILKKFGSNLCDYITEDNGSLEAQRLTSPPFVPQRITWPLLGMLQKLTNAEMQGRGFSNVLKKVGSALCRAAYDNSNPNALAEAFPSMGEAEIEGVRDFLERFGSNLCDYITEDNGGLSEQGYTTSFDLTKQYPWPREELSKAEVQGFLNTARKVGSALCRAAYDGRNPRAFVESLGLTDEVEIQRFTDFLKRFGGNLCDYVTEGGEKITQQSRIFKWPTQKESQTRLSAEEQGFFRKIGSALCRAAYEDQNLRATAELMGLTDEAEVQKFTDLLKTVGSSLCNYITTDSRRRVSNRPAQIEQSMLPIAWQPGSNGPTQPQWSNAAKKQGIRNAAKKIGSALCRAAYSPSAAAESIVSQGLMDEAEAQQFKDFLKRFGANLCDYITDDNGKMEAIKQDLVQELMAAEE